MELMEIIKTANKQVIFPNCPHKSASLLKGFHFQLNPDGVFWLCDNDLGQFSIPIIYQRKKTGNHQF